MTYAQLVRLMSKVMQKGTASQEEMDKMHDRMMNLLVVSPRRAAAIIYRDGATYCFCSLGSRDCFLRSKGS